ncbi:DUF5060 domain-containing protein [bacterium]|nr:DUF5060 domain-containing protein [bacterium]
MTIRTKRGVLAAVAALSAAACFALPVATSLSAKNVARHDVLEITFVHSNEYENPFMDAAVDVVFTSAGGREMRVGGFYHGSDEAPVVMAVTQANGRAELGYAYRRHDLWKARLAVPETGEWSYVFTFTNMAGGRATGSGRFACTAGGAACHGFLRINPSNAFRWVHDDGTPFYGVGLQECLGDNGRSGSLLAGMNLEGPFRENRPASWPPLPEGPLFLQGPGGGLVNGDIYFRRYTQCGFNLFRYSQNNCSPKLFNEYDRYLPHECRMVDELLQRVRAYGLRVMYGLFGYQNVHQDAPEDERKMAGVKRFVKYSVDRWGAYADIWQLLNEQVATSAWYAVIVPYLRSIDPYRHPVTTSWERPELDGIDVNAPHAYQTEHPLISDSMTARNAARWKAFGKPVIVGEEGNRVVMTNAPPGSGGVWDPASAQRMRVRLWAALFNEMSFIFWNTSYAKDGHYMNIWLGPYERQHVSALQAFSRRLDAAVKMATPVLSDTNTARAYGLASAECAAAYLFHSSTHTAPLANLAVTIDVPRDGAAYWYNPADGAIVTAMTAAAGIQTFTAPSFVVDLALLVTAAGAPDNDNDGAGNDVDQDDDNDGVPDTFDVFPLEPSESKDTDGDMIGDATDADDDGDGIPDDANANGIPDFKEMDMDGDGVPRAHALPWDAFPDDPNEWRDADANGIGDNAQCP